jgi:TRAP transporter 4TM/12TM fusion protein
MYISQGGIFGIVLGVSATFVFLFILLGSILNHSKSGEIIIDLAYSLFGRFRGGPAKVGVFASGMFGSISGSAVGNVVGTGIFTIPLMRKVGYSRHFAGAVEATASTGGQIMPPLMGSGAFLMVEFTGIPYWEIAIAATIPAILYYVSLYFAVDLYAGRRGIVGIPQKELPQFWITFKKGWHIFIPIVALLIFLITFKWSPIKSAFWTIILTLVVINLRRETRMGLKKLLLALADGAKNSVEVAAICACAGIVMGVINLTGIGVKLSSILIGAAGLVSAIY